MSPAPWDLRTTALAAGAWTGAAGAWVLGWWAPAGAAALLGVVTITRGQVRRHLLLVAGAAVLAGCVATLGSDARELPPRLVGADCEVTFVVTTDGRPLPVQPGRDPDLVVDGRLVAARLGTTAWRLDVPARLTVGAAAWRQCGECSPGAEVGLHASVAARLPADPGVRVRAVSAPVVVTPTGGVPAVTASVRAGLRHVSATAPPEAASLVSGLALGDESRQEPQFADTMRVAGLSHLTAVSGGNIVIVLLLVLLPVRSIGVGVVGQVVACGGALTGYVLLVGPQPSVLRAAALAAAGLVGIVLGGPARGAPVLSGCVFVLLLVVPELALSLGFVLSVAATAGLMLLAPALARRLRRIAPDWLALPLAVAVAAQLTSAPILLLAGAPVSWVSVPANLAAAPLVAPITVLGLAAALVAQPAPPVASLIANCAAAPAEVLAEVARLARTAAGWDVSVVRWPLGAAAAVVGAVLVAGAGGRRRHAAGVALVLAAGVMVVAPWRGPALPGDWRVVACDVDQGTAVLLRTGTAVVLVDTGPAGAGIGECLREADVAALDAVVLTHLHSDHVGALQEVLGAVPAAALVVGPGQYPQEGAAAVQTEAARHGLAETVAAAGDHLHWEGLDVDVLWPRPGDRGSADDVNDSSLVLVARWPDGASALVPGDVEPRAQARIVEAWRSPDVDVAVIPHHGSDHQDPRFAAWSAPVAAVASAGAGNSYGHPSGATLAEYAALGTAVQRTDDDGTVAYSWRDGVLVPSRG